MQPNSQEDRWRLNRADFLALGIFLLIVLWSMRGIISGSSDPFIVTLKNYEPWKGQLPPGEAARPQFALDDPVSQTYAYISYAHDRLQQGEFPLWNPHTFSGAPFIANRHTGLYNPLVFLPVRFLPPTVALALFYTSHWFLAGWFMYLFLKSLGLRRPAALFGAIAYILQGAYLPLEEIITSDNAYFPAVLYYLQRTCDRKDKEGIIGFIVSFALLAITGYPQKLVFLLYMIFAWVLFTFGPGTRAAISRVAGLVAMLAVGTLLGAMQHLPMLEFYRVSLRSLPEFQAMFRTLTPAEQLDSPLSILATGFPRLCGDYLTDPALGIARDAVALRNYFYIGVLSAFGAVFAPLVWRNRHAMFFTVIFLFGWLLTASNSFYVALINVIPGFRISQGKPYFFCMTAMIIVSAFVLDHLIKHLPQNPRLFRKLSWFGFLLIGLLIGLIAVYIQTVFSPMLFPSAYKTALGWVISGLIVLAVATIMLFLYARKSAFGWTIWVIIALELVDLVPYDGHFNALVHKGSAAFPTPSIEFLQKQMAADGPFRIFRDRFTTLRPNSLMLFGLDDMGGFDSTVDADYGNLFRSIDPGMIRDSRYIDMPYQTRTFQEPFWSFLGVRYFISPSPIELPPPWKEAWTGEVHIYENTAWLPRFFLVPSIVPVTTLDQGYAESRKIDPANEAVVEGIDPQSIPDPLNNPSPLDSGNAGSVRTVSYESDSAGLQVQCPRDAYLVFSDTWFPGWRAFIDGKETPIYRTDGVVKGIVVQSGNHTVRFVYNPESQKFGWLLSGVGLLLGLALIMPIRRLFVLNSPK